MRSMKIRLDKATSVLEDAVWRAIHDALGHLDLMYFGHLVYITDKQWNNLLVSILWTEWLSVFVLWMMSQFGGRSLRLRTSAEKNELRKFRLWEFICGLKFGTLAYELWLRNFRAGVAAWSCTL